MLTSIYGKLKYVCQFTLYCDACISPIQILLNTLTVFPGIQTREHHVKSWAYTLKFEVKVNDFLETTLIRKYYLGILRKTEKWT